MRRYIGAAVYVGIPFVLGMLGGVLVVDLFGGPSPFEFPTSAIVGMAAMLALIVLWMVVAEAQDDDDDSMTIMEAVYHLDALSSLRLDAHERAPIFALKEKLETLLKTGIVDPSSPVNPVIDEGIRHMLYQHTITVETMPENQGIRGIEIVGHNQDTNTPTPPAPPTPAPTPPAPPTPAPTPPATPRVTGTPMPTPTDRD